VPIRTYEKPLHLDIDFDKILERFAQTDPKEVEQAMKAAELQPLALIEDAETGDRFVLYKMGDGQELELHFESDEPWATERQIAELFGVTQQNANYHINNIYKDGELPEPETTYKEFLYVGKNGQPYRPKAYNLDVVLAVGQRVKSKEGILFRRWARQIERQYLLKGFVINKERLKDPAEYGRIQELRRIIAEIRASDVNFYGELRQICAMAKDYDAKSPAWQCDIGLSLFGRSGIPRA
jgi:hypothetical protein